VTPSWLRWTTTLLAISGLALAAAGCDPADDDDVAEIAFVDTDGDGLWDDFETQIATDPAVSDTDGDGYVDGDEWSMFTNPLDAADYEYLDGNGNRVWDHHAYPLDLEGTGSQFGEVLPDFSLPNYWVQQTSLYSFYGNVIQVVSTADS